MSQSDYPCPRSGDSQGQENVLVAQTPQLIK